MKNFLRPFAIFALASGTIAGAQTSPSPAPPPPSSPTALNFAPIYDAQCDISKGSESIGNIRIAITSRGKKRYAEVKSSDDNIFRSNRRVNLAQPMTMPFTFNPTEKVAYSDYIKFSSSGRRYTFFLLFDGRDQLVRAGANYFPEGGGAQTSVNLNNCLLTKALTK